MTTWAEIAPDILCRLLGEPNPRLSNQRELRWGRKGSLKLDLNSGSIFDFQDYKGYGVLGFTMAVESLSSKTAAAEHLRSLGFQLPENPKPSLGYANSPPGAQNTTPRTESENRPPAAVDGQDSFWKVDLPRLDYAPIPDHPQHPLNLWAQHKCGRQAAQHPWPAVCRWLKGNGSDDPGLNWIGGMAVMVPLAPFQAWGKPPLQTESIHGIHAVYVNRDGTQHYRFGNGTNCKLHWHNGLQYPTRSVSGCVCMLGEIQIDRPLAICEGIADALAIHWHTGHPVIASLGGLQKLLGAVPLLKFYTNFPYQVTLDIWPDRDIKASPRTGLRAGQCGALRLWQSLTACGVNEERIRIAVYEEGCKDAAEHWQTATAVLAHQAG